MKIKGDKAVCEAKPGFKYTRGNDALAPGCGHCWCCEQVQPDDKYKCYPKYTKDELRQMKTKGEKAVCEAKPGFKYTGGNDALAPGCGHCWCCEPVQPAAPTPKAQPPPPFPPSKVLDKYKCYPTYTKDELQQIITKGHKAVCEAKPGFKYTGGFNAVAPGCGHCLCCEPVQPGKISDTEYKRKCNDMYVWHVWYDCRKY